jgi:hypothetical protein
MSKLKSWRVFYGLEIKASFEFGKRFENFATDHHAFKRPRTIV